MSVTKASKLNYKKYASDLDAVFKLKWKDPKQKIYYMLDHWLCLPEYIVYYEYSPSYVSYLNFLGIFLGIFQFTGLMGSLNTVPQDLTDPMAAELAALLKNFENETTSVSSLKILGNFLF